MPKTYNFSEIAFSNVAEFSGEILTIIYFIYLNLFDEFVYYIGIILEMSEKDSNPLSYSVPDWKG